MSRIGQLPWSYYNVHPFVGPITKLELHKKEPKKLELQKKEPSKLELHKLEPITKKNFITNISYKF